MKALLKYSAPKCAFQCARMTLAILLAMGCSGKTGENGETEPTPEPTIPYETLSEYGLFEGDGSSQTPSNGVVPYTPISHLFSDYATKIRFIQVPEGKQITYENEEKWNFPEGSILIKTFAYLFDMRDPSLGQRLIETRLLIRQEDTWGVHTYLWNEEQTEASRKKAGVIVPVTWIDAQGEEQSVDYRVPNNNQCLGCHGDVGMTEQLGPRTRQLNTDHLYGETTVNQIDYINSLGWFDTPPPAFEERPSLVDPFGSADVETRARSYLEANCAHCHNNQQGFAVSSGLYLDVDTSNPVEYGVCRSPVAAGEGTGGFSFDILPGHPEKSILIFRMESTEPEVKMPEMPSLLYYPEGNALISQWIAEMPATGCGN